LNASIVHLPGVAMAPDFLKIFLKIDFIELKSKNV